MCLNVKGPQGRMVRSIKLPYPVLGKRDVSRYFHSLGETVGERRKDGMGRYLFLLCGLAFQGNENWLNAIREVANLLFESKDELLVPTLRAVDAAMREWPDAVESRLHLLDRAESPQMVTGQKVEFG